jgi:hypothetical protein
MDAPRTRKIPRRVAPRASENARALDAMDGGSSQLAEDPCFPD